MDKELLSVKDVAKMLNGTEAWIKKLVKLKKMPSYKICGKRLFDKQEIIDWIESQKEDPKD